MSTTKPSRERTSEAESTSSLDPWEQRDREIMDTLRRELHDEELIKKKNKALAESLRSWREEGDEVEQKETWEFLRRALDEDRLSDRKLFPCD